MRSSVLSSAMQHFILQRLSDHTVIFSAGVTLPGFLTIFDLRKKENLSLTHSHSG